ncbi:MAG: TRAP transporter small permease [Acidimicrobiales bacterium]
MIIKLINWLRVVNRWLHYLAGAVLVFILAITLVNIVGREFNEPLAGTVEVTALLMTLVVFLGIPHGEDEGVHITVDLLYERVGPRTQRNLTVFGRAVGLVVMAMMSRQLWLYANIQADGGYTTTVREWDIAPFVRAAAFGTFMLVLATAANLIVAVFGLDELEHSPGVDDDGELSAI